ncbi:MAG: DUF2079 domain-containing protein [Anaerolineae bacterium]|nr:DUF2079 domain-containing protein [Anaerolineae bacterium]
MPDTQFLSKLTLPRLLLASLIILYTLYFSWYSINRHNTLNSYAADLSLIDQPMWNTIIGPGGFMEQTWGSRQQPRLAEHFEPILIPLALLFFIWDNVRILLMAQSLALALGALPVFWIAQHQFTQILPQLTNTHPPPNHSLFIIHHSSFPAWIALVFATAYLLSPHLQAANIADFHADPFVVTPLLFAFWYAGQKHWGWMWLWAAVAMLTKETLPPLIAMLGLYLLLEYVHPKQFQSPRTQGANRHSSLFTLHSPFSNPQFKHALGLILVSTAWFLIATFLIVAPLARYYFGTDGPIYLASRFSENVPVLQILLDPARGRYLFGLLAAAGFLPLLAPELLLVGLPVLLANLLSNFPGQYSGEQHYSAPLVAVFIVAAIYGASRLAGSFSLSETNGQNHRTTALIALALWLSAWSIGYHTLHGWTPFSIRTEIYQTSAASTRLAQLLSSIPAEAVVSASPGLHPHVAHRRVAYVFPTIQDADVLLIDVTDISGVHPNDAYAKIEQLLKTNWQLIEASDGLILAEKSLESPLAALAVCPGTQLPCPFFDFAQATSSPIYPIALSFGDGRLQLLGYDVIDDPDDGVVFRFYWQADSPLPADLKLWPLVYDDLGQLLSDPSQVPMITTVWYPPSAWPANQVITTETLPQLLPDSFHLGIAAGPDPSFSDPRLRYPIAIRSDAGVRLHPGNWAQLASFTRQGPFLTHLPPESSLTPLFPIQAQFGSAIHLTGYRLMAHRETGLQVLLKWVTTEPLPTNFTVFIHLLASDGTLVSQSDAFPRWLTPQPTSQWLPQQSLLDSHLLSLPADLPPDTYTLQLGWYDAETLERLPMPDGSSALELDHVRLE